MQTDKAAVVTGGSRVLPLPRRPGAEPERREIRVGTVLILDTSAASSSRMWGDLNMYGFNVTYHFG